jgi:Ca2+/H+ antiporter, TMEM165/GDT1 family
MRKILYFLNYRKFYTKDKRHKYIPLIIIVSVFAFSYVIMLLWNDILPEVLGVRAITFWQAIGIFILSKILFGGFHLRQPLHYRHEHRQMNDRFGDMREKMLNLSTEEKEKMKKEWQERFDQRFKHE